VRTQTVNRLHQLLMELIPSGAPRNLTATKARALLATVRPRDVAGKARRQLAADYIDDLTALDRKLKALNKRIAEAVAATGTTLTDIVGVGPVTAAAILGEVGNVARFPDNDHFASYTGTAPIEVSSGEVVRHRLSRAGTGASTTRSTSSRWHRNATTTSTVARTTPANSPPAKAAKAHCVVSSDASPTPSIDTSSTPRQQKVQEGQMGRHSHPARLT